MSAELALGLRPGEPCLVCGGTEHPAPAGSTTNQVDADDERAAQLAHERAATASQQLAARRTSVLARCAELGAVSRGIDVPTATAALASRVDELARAEAAAEVVRLADLSLAAAAQSRAEATLRHEAARHAASAAASRLSELEPLVAEQQAALSAVLGGDVDVPARQPRLRGEIDVLTTWDAAAREAAEAQRRRDELLQDSRTGAGRSWASRDVPAVRDALLERGRPRGAAGTGVERHERTDRRAADPARRP